MKLSLVIPCYNEENNIEPMFDATKAVFDQSGYSYEAVFVNDGSTDGTEQALRQLYKSHPTHHIKVINFSRNFGKEAAILAGLKNASGEYVTLIDADLQQRPEVALSMVKTLDEKPEYDCVAAFQDNRSESKALIFFKNTFYKLINKIADTKFVNGASDFRTMRRSMVNAVLSMTESHRFSKGILSWVGFNTMYIPYNAEDRNSGTSKWSFKKLVSYAIEGIVAFSTFPLKFVTVTGLLSSFGAFIGFLVVLIRRLCGAITLPGYASVVLLLLFFGGLQLCGLGLLCEYLSKIYLQVKNRPIYIIKEVLCNEQKTDR